MWFKNDNFFNGGTIFFFFLLLPVKFVITSHISCALCPAHNADKKTDKRSIGSSKISGIFYPLGKPQNVKVPFFFLFFTSYEAEKTTRGWQKIVQNIKMILGNEDTAFFFFLLPVRHKRRPPRSFSLWHALINTDCSKTLLNTVLGK